MNELIKFDISNMHRVYENWPEIAKESYEKNYESGKFEKISHIVFCGMGGSGAIGDIFSSILSKTKIHVTVVKGYLIPNTVDNETLVVPISISGNTVETLAALESAIRVGSKIIAFTSGGEMEKICKKNNIDFRIIPMIHSPRASFGIFLFAMLKILESILPINKKEVREAIEELKETKKKITYKNSDEKNFALEFAKWIDKIPIIYYPFGLESAAIRFKNSLQENAKIHAIAEDVIEACHNGIVSWEKESMIKPILVEGIDDHKKTKERWDILKKFFELNSIQFKEIHTVEGGILSKIINLIYFLDYVSIYVALLSKTDPTPVNAIDFIKNNV